MKILGTILASSLVIATASADLAVDFLNDAGTVTEAGSSGGTFVDQVLVQLIWTASTPTQQAGLGGALGAGEVLLHSLVTTSTYAGTWSDQPQGILEYADSDVGDVDINDGYFFVRMFDNTATGLGDFYLQQGQQGSPLTEYDSGLIATIYDTNGELGGLDLDAQGNQVIPEPAVAALLGIFGGGMLVSRRLFSKKS